MKNLPRRMTSLVLVIALAAGISGCWDKVEIDDRAFVLALAIDKFEYSEEEKARVEEQGAEEEQQGMTPKEYPADSRRNRIVVSIVYPNVGLLGGKGGLIPEDMKFPMSTVGPDIYECLSQLAISMSKDIFLGHLKAVLVGEGLAADRQLFMEVLDDMDRNSEISRNVYFIVVEGKAQQALFIEPLVEPIIGTYIEKIFETSARSSRFHQKKLGDVLRSLDIHGDALAPRLVMRERELAVAGSSVIKDYRHAGWLGEIETRAVQWIDNMVRGGIITVYVDDIPVPYEITEAGREIKIQHDAGGNLRMHILLKGEGNIVGYKFAEKQELMDDKFIKSIEKAIEEEVVAECTGVMDKLQHQFGVDIWGFSEYLRKYHPEIYDEVGKDWEEIFPEVKMLFSSDIKIRRIGITK
ncbi:MAG: Ger(x)C family spore germination protein [Bacillota bacterium]|nr:Ger(x)C family spore germination protein [Bacillota bacterium]